MNWFRVATRWWETVLLAIAVVLLFRPDALMDRLSPPTQDTPASRVFDVAKNAETDETLVMVIRGTTIEGEEVAKTVALQLGDKGPDGRKRLADGGLQVSALGDKVQISAVKFGSRAQKSGFEQGWDVATLKVPTDRPSAHWFYLPALVLVAFVWWNQGRRLHPAAPKLATA